MIRKNASPVSLIAAISLGIAVLLPLAGCENADRAMTQEEVQYLSHIDQARFFQRQGLLKASTLEARSAIDLQPQNADPYLVIADNLITAGDALNAERQLNQLKERLDAALAKDTALSNRINLALAHTYLLRGQHEVALKALGALRNQDRSQQLEEQVLRGDIHFAANRLNEATLAYQAARGIDNTAVMPLIGMSRIAFKKGDKARVYKLIEEAEKTNLNDSALWLWKAQVAQADHDYPKAEEAYIRALEDIGQYDIMTYRKYQTIAELVFVLREQGKAAEAFVYEEILAKSAPGTIKSNFEAAEKSYKNGDLTSAAAHLEEILKQSPSHEKSSLMLGMIRFQQGRIKEAEELLAPFAKTADAETASKLLAAAKIKLQHPEEARAILEKLKGSHTDPDVIALVGIAAFASGDEDTGRQYLKKALSIKPDNHALRLRYATYLLTQKDYANAIEQVEFILSKTPDEPNANNLLVSAYLQSKQMDQAQAHVDAWLKRTPDSATALRVAGDLAFIKQTPKIAQQLYMQALSKDPQDVRSHLAMAQLALSGGDKNAALTHYRHAIELAPENPAALSGIVNTGMSNEDKRDETIRFLNEITDKQPQSIGPRLILLESALSANNLKPAEQITKTIENSANYSENVSNLVAAVYASAAMTANQKQNDKLTQSILEQGKKHFPESGTLLLASAKYALIKNDPATATELLSKVKFSAPESAAPYLLEADHRAGKGEFEPAAELYTLALEKERQPNTWLKLASSLQAAKQPTKAIRSLEDAVKAFPAFAPLKLQLAMAYQSAGDDAKAQTVYEALIKIAPDQAIALNNLAWIYFEQNKPEALDLAARAYALAAESAAIADTYGWILLKNDKITESLPVLEKAHAIVPATKEIALHLADAYKAAGMDDKAKAILQKVSTAE